MGRRTIFKIIWQKTSRSLERNQRLYQEGKLIKVKKGVYRYEPEKVKEIKLFDFPSKIKEKIFKRDNYRCVVCGRGRKEGVEICADHIIPLDRGGTNALENGQTLCMEHNLLKKNYSQTEMGKRFLIKIYKKASAKNDKKMVKFCKQIFDIYNKFQINTHIKRPNRK